MSPKRNSIGELETLIVKIWKVEHYGNVLKPLTTVKNSYKKKLLSINEKALVVYFVNGIQEPQRHVENDGFSLRFIWYLLLNFEHL